MKKTISIEHVLGRVSRRKPYRNHWGQRLLGASKGLVSELDTLEQIGLAAGVAFILAALSLWGFAVASDASIYLLATLSLVISIIFLRCVAGALVSAPLRANQIEGIQAWMMDFPDLTTACACWIANDETLRQRDYHLLKWARDKIVNNKKAQQIVQPESSEFPLTVWIERSRHLVQTQAWSSSLPSNMPLSVREKLLSLASELDSAQPVSVDMPLYKAQYVKKLHDSHHNQSFFEHDNVPSMIEALIPHISCSVVFSTLFWICLSNPSNLLLSSTLMIIALGLYLYLMVERLRWATGTTPLSPIGTNKLKTLAFEYPCIGGLFFSHIPKDSYLTYAQFKIFWRMVMVFRPYEREVKLKQQMDQTRDAIMALPAARLAIARKEARELHQDTPHVVKSTAGRRL